MGITAAIGGIADALGGAAVADVGADAAIGGLGSVIGGAAATDALAAGGLGSVIGGAAATDALAAGGADAALGGGLGSVIGGAAATDALAGGAGAASANAGLAGAVGATTGLAAAPGGAGAGTLGSLGGGAGVSAAGAAAPASIAPGAGDALTLFSSDAPAAAAGGYTPGVTATDAFAQGGGAVTSGPLGSVGDTAAFDAAGTPGSGLTSAAGAATNGLPVPPVPPAGGAGAGNVDGGLSFGNSTVNGGLAAGAGSPSSGVGSALGGVGHFLGNNANWLLPAALVGYQGLKSSEGLGNIPGYNQLNAQAGQLASQGSQLQSYLQTGTLPPGVQTSLQQAGSAATASIKSQYAARGDAGSTAEAQDIANVQNTLASQGAQIATQLLDTGISESNLSAQLYSKIMGANMQNDQQLGNALTTLAAGAARPTVTVNQASP